MKDGLSQKDRLLRIGSAKNLSVTDSSMSALLRQAEEIAGFIRYYNLNSETDGYFDEFIGDLKSINTGGAENFAPDGNMEPSQALLFTFVKQLHGIASSFNQRWKNFAYWYINHYLKLKSLPVGNQKVYIRFAKNCREHIRLEKGLGFFLKNDNPLPSVYKLTNDVIVEDICVKNAFALHFCKQKDIFPAARLNFVTSLRLNNLPDGSEGRRAMFKAGRNEKYSKAIGFMLASPSLLLKEGKRTVTIIFEFEKDKALKEYVGSLKSNYSSYHNHSDESLQFLMLNNIFYVNLSTTDGWCAIQEYTLKKENGCLKLKFTLPEDFPATVKCNAGVHDFDTEYPALKIHLNVDAWLYPYSWIKHLLIKKIRINTMVDGISNILVYNDLGKIDTSKPFAPFGINTEKGAWLAIGNYEMAVKNVRCINLKIEWQQLPEDPNGLAGYYNGYGKGIDNRSFKLRSRYLMDYQWKELDEHFLFPTHPANNDGTPHAYAPLGNITYLKNIMLDKMPGINKAEEDYEYNIQAKTGFVSFVLSAPDTGFGEKYYRAIFTEHLMRNALRKKVNAIAPNPPIMPLVSRLTLGYTAEDIVDFRTRATNSNTCFYHISPLGYHRVFPNTENNSVPFIYSMEPDANIMLQLGNIRKGECLSLYFNLHSTKKEISAGQIPVLSWHTGNGYEWRDIPYGNILEDTTGNLLCSGIVRIYIPKDLEDSLFDNDGNIWLRIGIEKNEENIPGLQGIYANIGVAELKIDKEAIEKDEHSYSFTGELEPEQKIAGLTECCIIGFSEQGTKETAEKKLLRLSEYVSHRGKAVTPRDFERLTLQAFPEIDKVKCLPCYNCKSDTENIVTLVVVPGNTTDGNKRWLPMADTQLILRIEAYFKERVSGYVNFVDVINPEYEEVIIRCRVSFTEFSSTAACLTKLNGLFNGLIAPWQAEFQSPGFNYTLDLHDIKNKILQQEYVEAIDHLSVIHITKAGEKLYNLSEYKDMQCRVLPSKPYAVFIPAKEHIILTGYTDNFGIDEMSINGSFIIQ